MVDSDVDDILAPRRQAEIEEVVDVLERFRPTKVAVEMAAWFKRNVRIYGNVLNLIDSPDERVLVIFGARHLGWLRHDFETDPGSPTWKRVLRGVQS